jgi:hypothetical protein
VRGFIEGLCLDRVGPQELKRLVGIYRAPKFGVGKKRKADKTGLPLVRVYHCINWWDMTEEQERKAIKDSKAFKRHAGFELDFINLYKHYRLPKVGEVVIQITYRGKRRHLAVPPARVIGHSTGIDEKGKNYTTVHMEYEDLGESRFSSLPAKLRTLLDRNGLRSAAKSKAILELWRKVNEDLAIDDDFEEATPEAEPMPTLPTLRVVENGVRLR